MDTNLDAQRVLQFVRYNEPAGLIGCLILAAAYLESHDARLGILLGVVLLNWGLIRRARWLLKRDRVSTAVISISTGMWAVALALWLVVPPAYGLALLIGAMPIVLAAAYVREGVMPAILCSVVVAVLGGIYYGTRPVLAAGVSPALVSGVIAVFAPALTVSCALAVWHSTRRLLELVDQMRAVNRALEESERTLEQKVEERTAALQTARDKINAELSDAAAYVNSVMPTPLTGARGINVDWSFEPSVQLGGDTFTYFWLDENHFVIALLDVCGHGVGPALHGMAAIHSLRSWTSPGMLADPSAVLRALNQHFQMETHHGLFMTVWYGVYDVLNGHLRYASGGHPPALLMTGDGADSLRAVELSTSGPIVGVLRDSRFTVETIALGLRSELFVYSDGAFELTRPDGSMLAWRDFLAKLGHPLSNGRSKSEEMRAFCHEVADKERFDDDFLLLHVSIQPPVGGWPGRTKLKIHPRPGERLPAR